MKAIKILILIAGLIIILVNQTYAQDIEKRGGIRISTGPAPTETVKHLFNFF